MKNLEKLTIGDYIDILRRRIWYVVVTTILVSAGTVVAVLRLPPIYRSETTIAFSTRFLPEDYIRSIDRQTNTDRMDFVRQQLQSRTFLEAIVHEFHFGDPGPDGLERALKVVQSKIEITVVTTSTFKLAFSETDPNLAQAVTKRLTEGVIQLNDSSRKEKVLVADQFLEEQLHQAANELSQAEEKVLQVRNQSFPGLASEAVTPDNLRELQIQLASVETKLESALDLRQSLFRRLEEHRQLKMVLKAPPPPPPPQSSPAAPQPVAPAPSPFENQLASKRAELAAASRRYTSLHPEVARLTQEVQELELLARQSAPPAKGPTPAPAVPKEDRQEITSSLPELDASLDLMPAEIQLELDQVARDIAKAEREKSALVAKILAYQTRLNPPPVVAQELAQVTREYDVAKQRYSYLSDKRLNSEMAARVDSSENNEMFRVIDAAFLPQNPIGPNRRFLASLGGLAGLLLGLGLAFLRDYLDPTLHSEEDAIGELKLPVLASVPIVPDDQNDKLNKKHPRKILQAQSTLEESGTFSLRYADGKIRNVILDPLCFASEPYRLLHSRLLAMQKQRPLKSILLSSATPNEGKTFTACCIAGVLAQGAGKKVLLIDADLRRSSATNVLGLSHRKSPNNLSGILRGKADFKQSLLRCTDLNLYFLPSGTMSSNPTEILSSPELERLLREVKQEFDWVIVDSPPVLALADANLMLPHCDGVLLVVNSGKTPTKLVKESIQRVSPERICGVLMNRVKTFHSTYYYAGYYQAAAQQSSKSSNLNLTMQSESLREN